MVPQIIWVYTQGVSVGDAILFEVYADNGGTDLISQSWGAANIIGSSFSAGTYSATTSGLPQSGGSSGGFSTDASGALSLLDLAVRQGGVENNGPLTNFDFYMNDLNDIWYGTNTVKNIHSVGAVVTPNRTNVGIALTPVPLPASLPLLLAGFAGLGLIARRRK